MDYSGNGPALIRVPAETWDMRFNGSPWRWR
jgi:hypothetical protein